MDIYLDANATTPVLPQARAAALQAMADDYGNPSSVHGTGLKARAMMDAVRARARRVLRVSGGHLLFTSGATEGIQTAVLSALSAMRDHPDRRRRRVLVGATEHKAVPEAIQHWNAVLGLGLRVEAIPVDAEGRHDLAWLRERATDAGLVCTMAVNNETGVVSDLDGIAAALRGSGALWLVDSVQALGKLDLALAERPIDYATFSGHKLYAPKGIGLLYARDGAPVTPLLAGGGQEEALRSGTENMPGIAALGAVLQALEEGQVFQPAEVLAGFRARLVQALREAFPDIVFNAPEAISLPTTLNFSVPGVPSKVLLDAFDAAALRLSGGSACSSSRALPSDVLVAMGLPAWRAASAVRLSFGPATEAALFEEACGRIRACGQALRDSCLTQRAPPLPLPSARVTRQVTDGACCYLVADPVGGRCVVIDPQPGHVRALVQAIGCRRQRLTAVLATGRGAEVACAADALWSAMPAAAHERGPVDAAGWPLAAETLRLGSLTLRRLPPPSDDPDARAYLLEDDAGARLCFAGDALGDMAGAASAHFIDAVGPATLLLPAHDAAERWACRLGGSAAPAGAATDLAEPLQLGPAQAAALVAEHPEAVLVDVREPFEQRLGRLPAFGSALARQAVPLSAVLDALPGWLALPDSVPLLFFCRSGNRSSSAAAALRRLGHAHAYSLAGGLALWPAAA